METMEDTLPRAEWLRAMAAAWLDGDIADATVLAVFRLEGVVGEHAVVCRGVSGGRARWVVDSSGYRTNHADVLTIFETPAARIARLDQVVVSWRSGTIDDVTLCDVFARELMGDGAPLMLVNGPVTSAVTSVGVPLARYHGTDWDVVLYPSRTRCPNVLAITAA